MEEKSKIAIQDNREHQEAKVDKKDISEFIPDTSWASPTVPKVKPSRKKDEEEYTARFLTMRKIKDYTPVYIDVQMKEKLQTLVVSLKYMLPGITPTILLSNILADHMTQHKELITRAANEGLKRSLASTFNEEK